MNEEQYFIDESNQLIDLDTGEIINRDDIKDAYTNKLLEQSNKYQDELLKIGSCLDIKIIKYMGRDYSVIPIKKNYTFGKVFRMSVRDLMKENKLSKNAKVFIATFEPYIYFPYNSLVVENANPNIEIICKMCDLKKSAIYEVFKELEQLQVIKKVKLNGEIIIYFNPFLYASGGVVYKDTYEMFKGSIYNPQNDK